MGFLVPVTMMLVLGGSLGLVLGFAAQAFHVEVDERLAKVTGMLPGLNCGSCGFTGCAGLAQALVEGKVAKVGACRPCKPDIRAQIADYLNENAPEGAAKVTAD
ncbi:MAG: electron transporter RnfB [Erysipelotrichaceae bacterium]|jgi:electron transport complex protein RnfB|nr:electron transporter RnfB [Erysipelotrichaceae bacterium]